MALLVWSCNNIFFWDTIQLASKHAHYFYDCKLSCILLPDEFDSGHIPLFGYTLAVIWKIFGKSLIVSHIMMWPFVIGILYQYIKLSKQYLPSNFAMYGAMIFLCDPTLLSQITLVSPDVVLIFCVIFLLRKIENFKLNVSTIIVITLLCLISLRGAMTALCFGLCLIISNAKKSKDQNYFMDISLSFLPGCLLFCAYMYYHYAIKGWIGFHEDSPWAPSFQRVDFDEMIWNMGIIFWRLIDFGRVVWVITLILIIIYHKKLFVDFTFKKLILLSGFLFFILTINSIQYSGLLAHRYFMPIIISASFSILYVFYRSSISEKLKYTLTWLIAACLLLGNLIIYPLGVSQGWDASLAHLPYYNLRKEMYKFLDTRKIIINQVASSFPNLAKEKYISLCDSELAMNDYKSCDRCEYILTGNIYNEMNQQNLINLNDYDLIKSVSESGIFLNLYQLKAENKIQIK